MSDSPNPQQQPKPQRPDQQSPTDGADDSRAEQVLAQALRAMAGGGKAAPGAGAAGNAVRQRRLTTGQLVLLAAIVGLLIGIGAGFISLML